MSAQPNPAGADMAGRLSHAFEQLGLQADAAASAKLLDYLAQMQRWNRTYNLTAIRDPRQMLVQHLFDSLAAVGPFSQALGAPGTPAKIYDVGSGGGLPGVVLAVMRPEWSVTCIDAVEKKTAFVRQMTGTLALPNLQARHARIETLEPAGCNIVTSRAFASLEDFAMLAGRHVGNDGTLVAMKGKVPDDEIQALHARGEWQVDHIQPLQVPELQAERCLIWMRRSQGTL
ncbi:16S rRNA (guanine(527)-N(7))-methyltransferase RsmG [Achromobacter ruhlandii]|jgi:16S rRNA (guanine527-N7)-methyltransferase|uniref:Ribosomal RNA small subunit methyltransferase G n=1 Tax=Achromobacter ruhlandii TaxID=72557 RepID=A0A848ND59_9BURK|nr:16S rRNA (guanine(527)-N(7))-methyltransferase RsmG [Achromobacter ruhlandii]AKP92747.1 rRNA small subunit methyltransferase, glucose inhibited division protein GidB [Achromobacter xylosoxidans]AOU96589.1 rRNA small subunit 7-methylguanosine methyltransferase G [Achromobacter ruhlandii]MCV6794631.1 16S rRNA (guanine(527)-N(7))-methyltransferase RsmG [Achromobacter ruhlandii]MCV6800536.1 16S rRNA (guanine(527)-N(7))-methyltransferase RsmG [Achromobacter ruhlandii]MCV6808698.1 16S rRNA (guani